jgi:hypothetical protein
MKRGFIKVLVLGFLSVSSCSLIAQDVTNKILKYTGSTTPTGTSVTNIIENSDKSRFGYGVNTTADATFEIRKLIPTDKTMKISDNNSSVIFLDNNKIIYQNSSLQSSYNYFGSKVGIGIENPAAQLHVNGSGIISSELTLGTALKLSPGTTNGVANPFIIKNEQLGSRFEFWTKYDESATGGGGASEATESLSFIIKTGGQIEAQSALFNIAMTAGSVTGTSKVTTPLGMIQQLTSIQIQTGTLAASTSVSSPLGAIQQINSSLVQTTSCVTNNFKLATSPGNNWVLKSDATGNASWADPSTLFSGANLWQSNTNSTIFTAAPAVGIGTNNTGDYKLAVNGVIGCKELKVEISSAIWSWPDFVFKPDYNLPSLTDIESFIDQNGHLPGVPSAEYVKRNGISVGEMQATLLQKIEELTLLMIEQQKQITKQQKEIEELKKQY